MEIYNDKVYNYAYEIFPLFDALKQPKEIISFDDWLLLYKDFYNGENDAMLKSIYQGQHLDYFAWHLINTDYGYRGCLINYIDNKIVELKKEKQIEEYSNKFYFLKIRGFNDGTEDYLMHRLPEEFSAFSVGDLYCGTNSHFNSIISEIEERFADLKNNSFLHEFTEKINNFYMFDYDLLNKLRNQIIAKVNRNGEPLPKKDVVNHLSEEELKRRREHQPEPEDILNSINRSKKMVKDLIRCGNMDKMLTLTYRQLVTNRKEVYDHLKKFFNHLRRGFSVRINKKFKKVLPVSFKYVATLEKHKSGGYHVHMAINGKFNYTYVRWAWQKAVGGNGTELLSDSLGYVRFTEWENKYTKTRGKTWNARKLASYLSKYMVEDFLKNYVKGQKRYFRSEFIDKPKENYIWLKKKDFDNVCQEFFDKTYELANFTDNDQYIWLSPNEATYLITGSVLSSYSTDQARHE